MASPLTVRLDDEIRERISRIARRKRVSTSDAIREAIEAWVLGEETNASPYEAVADLMGSVQGGDPNCSTDAGRKYAAFLKGRRSRQ